MNVVSSSLAAAAGVAILAAAPPAQADQQISLTEVLGIAVERAPSLELARIDLAIAEAAVLEATGVDDWILDATLAVARSSRERQITGSLTVSDTSNSVNLDADLVRSFSSGGTLTLHAETGLARGTDLGIDGMPSDFTNYDGGVSVTFNQPLLRGRGERYARAQVAIARIEEDVAELRLAAEAMQTVQSVVSAYWELAYAYRDLEIRESSVELAQERLRVTRAQIEGGTVAPTEALAVEQTIAQREEEVLSAQVRVAARSLELRRILDLPIDPQRVELVPTAAVVADIAELDTAALIAEMNQRSPIFAEVRAAIAQQEVIADLRENATQPALDAFASAGSFGFDDDAAGVGEQVLKADLYVLSAGLRLQHAFGNRAAEGAARAARESVRRQNVLVQSLHASAAESVILAVRDAEAARQRIELSQRAINLTEQNIEAEKARFDLGRATNFDVLQRQEELKQARLRHARAVVDYLLAIARLEYATGRILDTYGITLGT